MKKLIAILFIISIIKAEAQSSASVIADSLYATGNYTNAINYYAKEGSEKANLQIARAYKSIGNYDKAIIQYESLMEKAPELQIARFELGRLYLKTKRYDDGRKLFTGLVRNDANNPEYLYYQGESFRKLGQVASSLVVYKKAVAVDSTHLKSLFQLGKYFVTKKETIQALHYLDMGLQFYADDIALINLKALALFNNNEYEKALPLFERLIELGEKKEFVYTKLAHCYFKTWAFEEAKKTYKHLIEMDENNQNAYFNLGQVFFKDRQIDSAMYYVKKSIAVQEVSFENEYANLAYMYRSVDNLKSAMKYYKLAFKEDPSNYRNYYQLCMMIDQTSDDLALKLKHYETFIQKFGRDKPYISDLVLKRISELKVALHFAKD